MEYLSLKLPSNANSECLSKTLIDTTKTLLYLRQQIPSPIDSLLPAGSPGSPSPHGPESRAKKPRLSISEKKSNKFGQTFVEFTNCLDEVVQAWFSQPPIGFPWTLAIVLGASPLNPREIFLFHFPAPAHPSPSGTSHDHPMATSSGFTAAMDAKAVNSSVKRAVRMVIGSGLESLSKPASVTKTFLLLFAPRGLSLPSFLPKKSLNLKIKSGTSVLHMCANDQDQDFISHNVLSSAASPLSSCSGESSPEKQKPKTQKSPLHTAAAASLSDMLVNIIGQRAESERRRAESEVGAGSNQPKSPQPPPSSFPSSPIDLNAVFESQSSSPFSQSPILPLKHESPKIEHKFPTAAEISGRILGEMDFMWYQAKCELVGFGAPPTTGAEEARSGGNSSELNLFE